VCGKCVSVFEGDVVGKHCAACGYMVGHVAVNVQLGCAGDLEADTTRGRDAASQPLLCTECDEADHEIATRCCETCNVMLCDLYGGAHKQAKATTHHVVTAISQGSDSVVFRPGTLTCAVVMLLNSNSTVSSA
jgi:hypothetical protein